MVILMKISPRRLSLVWSIPQFARRGQAPERGRARHWHERASPL